MDELNSIDATNFFGYDKNKEVVKSIEELWKKFYKPKRVQNAQIKRWLDNPYDNIDDLQDLSQKMILLNGILKEFINYKSLILTNDHYIYPTDSMKYKDKETLLKDDMKVAEYIDRYNVKTLVSWVTKRMLQNGEIYLYKRETRDGVLMQEIPTKLCKIILLDEFGIFRYGVNMKKISEDEIDFFPQEIKRAYKRFNNSNGKLGKDFSGDYYIVGAEGVAFQLNMWDNKGLPYYIHLFTALTNLSDAQDLDNVNNALDNYKIIYQKALTDKEGKMLMSKDTLGLYHQALKNTVPSGVGVITSPLDIKSIGLNDGKLKNYEHVNNLKKGVYDNAGIASELFNGNAKTKESVLLSAVLDTLLPLEIQSHVERYLNFELRQKFKRGKWRVTFLPTTHFNKQDIIKAERENLTVYGSKKKYLAVQGLTPLESLNIIYAESIMELDEVMKPMQTAHTISSKNKSSEEDKTDEENEDDVLDDTDVESDDEVDEKDGVENENT